MKEKNYCDCEPITLRQLIDIIPDTIINVVFEQATDYPGGDEDEINSNSPLLSAYYDDFIVTKISPDVTSDGESTINVYLKFAEKEEETCQD